MWIKAWTSPNDKSWRSTKEALTWHHLVLLFSLGRGRWVCVTATREVQSDDVGLMTVRACGRTVEVPRECHSFLTFPQVAASASFDGVRPEGGVAPLTEILGVEAARTRAGRQRMRLFVDLETRGRPKKFSQKVLAAHVFSFRVEPLLWRKELRLVLCRATPAPGSQGFAGQQTCRSRTRSSPGRTDMGGRWENGMPRFARSCPKVETDVTRRRSTR